MVLDVRGYFALYFYFCKISSNLIVENIFPKARYQIGTIILRLLIPSTGWCVQDWDSHWRLKSFCATHYLQWCISQNCPISNCWYFFRDAMPSELYERVYLDRDGCLLVGSLDENNKTSSTFHDEALQMSMIWHFKSLRHSTFEELRRAIAWIQPFGNSSDTLTDTFGGRFTKIYHRRRISVMMEGESVMSALDCRPRTLRQCCSEWIARATLDQIYSRRSTLIIMRVDKLWQWKTRKSKIA